MLLYKYKYVFEPNPGVHAWYVSRHASISQRQGNMLDRVMVENSF